MASIEKFKLITRNLVKITNERDLKAIFVSRNPKILWNITPTGKLHLGHYASLVKIADFLRAGCEIVILIADEILDSGEGRRKLDSRVAYYSIMIESVLGSLDAPMDKLDIIKGTSFKYEKTYVQEMFKKFSSVSLGDNEMEPGVLRVTDAVSPVLRALDEMHLGVDAQFGGCDQTKTFQLMASNFAGSDKRIHLIGPMIPGLIEGTMQSSKDRSKIDLLHDPTEVHERVMSSTTAWGLSFCKNVVFPLGGTFGVSGIEKKGDICFDEYELLKEALVKKQLHPKSFKSELITRINALLDPIIQDFNTKERIRLVALAYPVDIEIIFK